MNTCCESTLTNSSSDAVQLTVNTYVLERHKECDNQVLSSGWLIITLYAQRSPVDCLCSKGLVYTNI